jgi:glycosyltransferase involved in cell wall biosynthesis
MRVIHVADYSGPHAGSFVPMLRAVTTAVRGRGGTVETAFSPAARDRPWLAELEADGVPFSFAPKGDRRGRARFLAALAGDRSEPAILHTHFTGFDLPAVSVARERPATPVFWHLHQAAAPARWQGRVLGAVRFAVAARRVDKILCVAPDIAASVESRHAPRDRVVVLPNAIDLDRFPRRSRARTAEARRRLRIHAGARVLLHFGWDWDARGGELFVTAARRLAEREPIVAVTVGGGGAARAARDRAGLGEDVVRVIDPIEDVALLYAAADVFVATSRSDGVPHALAEALASGLPVVATDIRSHADLAHRAGNVRLALSEPDEIAASVHRALATEVRLADEMGARARARVSSHMDLEAWSERVVALYERALAPHGHLY